MAEFPIPSFLENQSVDDIHKRMFTQMPSDIDKSEGGHPWNLTRPHAYHASYFAQFVIVEAIKLIFPKYAENYADIMDSHAGTRGLARKAATYATGSITITGMPGTEVPAGSSFSTASVNGEPAVEFVTTEDVIIPDSQSVEVEIRAVEAGSVGNVPEGTIILKANKISGISSVTNKEDTTGGTEEESTESLQKRIEEYDSAQGASFVGSEADYKRWAMEVNGTGNAVIIPAQDDSGLITIILTDANGKPANEELIEAVYNHIMRPDNPSLRLAPVNDGNINIVAPESVVVEVSVTIEAEAGILDMATIHENLLANLKKYIVEALQDKEIRYTKICSIVSSTEGVYDYRDLLVNGETKNIHITNQQLPVIEKNNLIITAGNVE